MIAALICLSAAVLPPLQDSTVRDFKRYFKRYDTSAERVELVYALQGIDDPDVAEALLPVLEDRDPKVAAAAVKVLSKLPSAEARVPLAEEIEKPRKARRVAAVARAAGEGGWKEFVPLLRPLVSHRDEEVRLWSATALGELGDSESVPALVEMFRDERNALLRVAALDALGKVGKPQRELAGAALVEGLDDEALEVQTAACLGLQEVRVRAAIPKLIDMMENSEGRILEHLYPTLVELTDMELTDDPALWRNWWNQAGERYELLSDEEIAARRAARKQANAQYVPSRTAASFVGVDTPSQRVVFVIDVSGSMEDLVVDRDSFRERGHTRFRKLDVVKKEMSATIEALESDVRFNVLAFATEIHPWKKGPVPANLLNKRSALEFVDRLQPIGGAGAQKRAAAGLAGSSGLDQGRTNTYGALLAAMGITGEESAAEEVRAEVDTVFFLSDGRPAVGDLVDPDDIQEAIRELNQFRRITIHTIAIGKFQKDFMEYLARDNGGTFTDLGG